MLHVGPHEMSLMCFLAAGFVGNNAVTEARYFLKRVEGRRDALYLVSMEFKVVRTPTSSSPLDSRKVVFHWEAFFFLIRSISNS